ncbi:histidine-specific methyltransferase [Chaetomium tenue]|uniref:Histidine-specific methyltransferase n=1 Tax=Chaetomium tenue TaxID=1854479 RepID=A0ACB7PAT1_9PEZI|nr:histidine-specific methyltransferase [Chaetomium globosum]
MGAAPTNNIQKELAPLIIEGLKSSPKFFPSLLLWDDKGLAIYERIMRSKDYYLTQTEAELIRLNADNIAETIPDGSVILELGSGCLSKTFIILNTLAQKRKHVVYYALDVCPSALAASLAQLRSALKHTPYVTCRSLCMTYQDGISWLANEPSLSGTPVSVLWLGSSFANEPQDDFRQLLHGISAAQMVQAPTSSRRVAGWQLLVAADGTKDPETVSRAYDTRDGLSKEFTLNVLDNANRSLGWDVFDMNQWCFDGEWDAQKGQFQTCIRALKDQTARVGKEQVLIKKGEKIKVIASRKLGQKDVQGWLVGTGFTISSSWTHPEFAYSLYRFSLLEEKARVQQAGWERLSRGQLGRLVRSYFRRVFDL